MSFLSKELCCEVRILTHRIPLIFEDWRKKYEIIQADVTDRKRIRFCCRGCDAVIHLASLDQMEAKLNPELALRVSGFGTRNVLEEAASENVERFLYFSTFHVYGLPETKIIDEKSSIVPLNDYGLAHYVGELYCHQYRRLSNLKTIIIRPSNGFGPPVHKEIDCWHLAINDFCKSAFEKGKIVLKSRGTQKRDFISIRDIIDGVAVLLKTEISKMGYHTFNLGSGVSRSIREAAELVKEAYEEKYKKKIKIELQGESSPFGFEMDFCLDMSRMKELGFKPPGLEQMKKEIQKIFILLESS